MQKSSHLGTFNLSLKGCFKGLPNINVWFFRHSSSTLNFNNVITYSSWYWKRVKWNLNFPTCKIFNIQELNTQIYNMLLWLYRLIETVF